MQPIEKPYGDGNFRIGIETIQKLRTERKTASPERAKEIDKLIEIGINQLAISPDASERRTPSKPNVKASVNDPSEETVKGISKEIKPKKPWQEIDKNDNEDKLYE